jgi:hypothetical protein
MACYRVNFTFNIQYCREHEMKRIYGFLNLVTVKIPAFWMCCPEVWYINLMAFGETKLHPISGSMRKARN